MLHDLVVQLLVRMAHPCFYKFLPVFRRQVPVHFDLGRLHHRQGTRCTDERRWVSRGQLCRIEKRWGVLFCCGCRFRDSHQLDLVMPALCLDFSFPRGCMCRDRQGKRGVGAIPYYKMTGPLTLCRIIGGQQHNFRLDIGTRCGACQRQEHKHVM